MDKQFDIFGQIKKEVQDFKQDRIRIAGSENNEDARYLKKEARGYFFSQYETLNLIDLYYNSKFETGAIDSEGQRKLFLNICAFRADVASKMIDLDTKDFVFIPEDASSKWLSYFITKEFKDWSKKNYFGELINEFVERFPKYGTIVSKKVGKEIVNIPLREIVIQQDAKDIQTASFFIQLHPKMTIDEMSEYPDWDTTGLKLDYGKTEMVYERYGKVPVWWYEKATGKKASKSKGNVDCVCIVTLLEKMQGSTPYTTGTVLFCEEVKERPYQEAHWKKQDGRWLGIGEIENLFENQISRNMIANMRRRALLWSSKKIFQSSDETVSKNLIRDVKDGDVMKIMPNGNITQVDMATRAIGEFQSAEDMWEHNSDQKSFTYDAATGENMPSGTPFRLGVIVSNAVNSHFKLKKQKLGIFLKKIIVENVYDIFLKENSKAHTVTVFGTEDGMNDLRKVASTVALDKRIMDWAMNDNSTEIPDFEAWKQEIEAGYMAHTHLFVEIPDRIFQDAKNHVDLTITGEEIDTATKVQNLTTLYQSLSQQGDPRAEQVLSKIMDLQGENLEAIIGAKPAPQPQQQMPQQVPQGQGIANPQLATNSIQA